MAYDTMMNIAFPALSDNTAVSSPDGHDQGMLFTQLSSKSTPLTLRGQKVITEPIYGNLLTSAMGQDDYVSSAATPAGASTLEPNEARLIVEIGGGEYGNGPPKIAFFYAQLLTGARSTGATGGQLWANDHHSATDEVYDGPSFSKWLRYFNASNKSETHAPAQRRDVRRGVYDYASEMLGYPHGPLNSEAQEEYWGAEWANVYGADFIQDGVHDEVTQDMTVGDGVVINMDEWAAAANAYEDDGYGSAEVVIAYEFLVANTTEFPDTRATKYRGILRMDWNAFQKLVGGGRYITDGGPTTAATGGNITSEWTGGSGAGSAFLVAEDHGAGNSQPAGDRRSDPGYTYPSSGGNHMVLYFNPWTDGSSSGNMVDGRSFQADRGDWGGGNYMAIGEILIERTSANETRWGYDL